MLGIFDKKLTSLVTVLLFSKMQDLAHIEVSCENTCEICVTKRFQLNVYLMGVSE